MLNIIRYLILYSPSVLYTRYIHLLQVLHPNTGLGIARILQVEHCHTLDYIRDNDHIIAPKV